MALLRPIDINPPAPICPVDLSKDLAPEPVSGRATVHTFTVNHQQWIPGYDPPYVIAIVEIDEQRDVRLMTNVVGCPPEEVHIGMPVQVTFDQHDDVWLPLFGGSRDRAASHHHCSSPVEVEREAA